MKCIIDTDELYPVYFLDLGASVEKCDAEGIEVPDDLVERYQRNRMEFSRIQRELCAVSGGRI